MEERASKEQSMGAAKTTREANDDVKAEIADIWKELARIERSMSQIEDKFDSEAEDLWNAVARVDKDLKDERQLLWHRMSIFQRDLYKDDVKEIR